MTREDRDAAYAYGVMLMESGQTDDAGMEFMKILSAFPDDADAQRKLDEVTGRKKRPAAVKSAPVKQAPLQEPAKPVAAAAITDPAVKRQMEKVYADGVKALNAGDNRRALELFQRILADHPDHQPSLLRAKKARKALQQSQ